MPGGEPGDAPAWRDDVVVLAYTLLPRVSNGRKLGITDEALRWLRDYSFPGNVRELRNLLERACLLSDSDEIDLRHLPAGAESPMLRSTAKKPGNRKLSDQELCEIARDFPGSRKELARHLRMSERTLYRRLGQVDAGAESA